MEIWCQGAAHMVKAARITSSTARGAVIGSTTLQSQCWGYWDRTRLDYIIDYNRNLSASPVLSTKESSNDFCYPRRGTVVACTRVCRPTTGTSYCGALVVPDEIKAENGAPSESTFLFFSLDFSMLMPWFWLINTANPLTTCSSRCQISLKLDSLWEDVQV
jgi:hypothetical protein